MSDYVYESGISSRRRRQRRTAITLLLTLLFLGGAFYWAWSYIRDGGTGEAGPNPGGTSTCSFADPRQVTVNVYNSTGRAGLAGAAAAQLTDEGFTVGDVANDPLERELPGFIELRYGLDGAAYAQAYKTYFQTRVSLFPVEREGTDLDVVLGDGFNTFDPPPGEIPAC
jgi:hypothetical protein